jgi:hypothetical protein
LVKVQVLGWVRGRFKPVRGLGVKLGFVSFEFEFEWLNPFQTPLNWIKQYLTTQIKSNIKF